MGLVKMIVSVTLEVEHDETSTGADVAAKVARAAVAVLNSCVVDEGQLVDIPILLAEPAIADACGRDDAWAIDVGGAAIRAIDVARGRNAAGDAGEVRARERADGLGVQVELLLDVLHLSDRARPRARASTSL